MSTELEVRRLDLEERRLENERRAARTPEEVCFDVAIRQATTLADSPVLYYDDERVEKLARSIGWEEPQQGAGQDEMERARASYRAAWAAARNGYRQERIAFAVQLLAFAAAMGVPVALLAGQAHIVKGRTGFATSFLVALVNARAGLREPISWEVSGEGAALAVTASAVRGDGRRVAETITLAQANAWGWARTTPWKADPALMLRWRAAAWLIRMHFGAAVFGLPVATVEELRDGDSVIDGVSEPVVRQVSAPLALPDVAGVPEAPPLPAAEPAAAEPDAEDSMARAWADEAWELERRDKAAARAAREALGIPLTTASRMLAPDQARALVLALLAGREAC